MRSNAIFPSSCKMTPRVIDPRVKRSGSRGRRGGRGFSRGELMGVGLTFSEALKLRIPIDKRRRSTYPENVRALEQFLKAVSKLGDRKKIR